MNKLGCDVLHKSFFRVLVIILIVLAARGTYAAEIENCGFAVNESGDYYLSQNIATTTDCLSIKASNVNLNCNFFELFGNGTGSGILVNNSDNVQIRNCRILNFSEGISLLNTNSTDIQVNQIYGNSVGIISKNSSSARIAYNSIVNNTLLNLKSVVPDELSAINNYWQFLDLAGINATISGLVNFVPFLQEDPYGDTDGDGIINIVDNCKVDFNPDQTDYDVDGKGDVCDVNLFLLNSVFDPMTESSNISAKLTTNQDTGYYLVQFNDSIEPGNNPFGNLSVEIFDFIPDNALIVYFDPSIRPQIKNFSSVRFVGILQPADRVEPGIYQLIINDQLPSGEVELSLAVFRNAQQVANDIESLGGQAIADDNSLSVVIDASKIIDIAFMPDVKYITSAAAPDFFNFKTPITVYVRPTSTAQNYYGYSGDKQVIGHIDTGIDNGHSDLVTANVVLDNGYTVLPIIKCTGAALGLINVGRGLENNDGTDPLGHGTSTGGVVVGQGLNGTSGNGDRIKGIAPSATLFSTKVCNAKGPGAFPRTLFVGKFDEKDVIKAYEKAYAYGDGARIHTNSWGSVTRAPSLNIKCALVSHGLIGSTPYDIAIDKFVFNKDDDLPAFAASNTGRDFPDVILADSFALKLNAFECGAYKTESGNKFGFGNLAIPATAKNVLTVGGSEQELPGCETVS